MEGNGGLCAACGGTSLITDSDAGEAFCRACGCVMADRIEDGRTAIRDSADSAATGHGEPRSLRMHDGLTSTVMARRDGSGRPVPAGSMNRLQRLNVMAVTKRTGTANPMAFMALDGLTKRLGLGSAVAENSAYLYRKACGKKVARGRSARTMAAASVYAACRQMSVPVTLRDVAEAGNEKPVALARCYRLLVFALGIAMPVADSVTCVSRIAGNAGLPERTAKAGHGILRRAADLGIAMGKSPMVLAATALYLAAMHTGSNVTQKRIAEAAGVTEVSLRNRQVELRPIAEEMLGGA